MQKFPPLMLLLSLAASAAQDKPSSVGADCGTLKITSEKSRALVTRAQEICRTNKENFSRYQDELKTLVSEITTTTTEVDKKSLEFVTKVKTVEGQANYLSTVNSLRAEIDAAKAKLAATDQKITVAENGLKKDTDKHSLIHDPLNRAIHNVGKEYRQHERDIPVLEKKLTDLQAAPLSRGTAMIKSTTQNSLNLKKEEVKKLKAAENDLKAALKFSEQDRRMYRNVEKAQALAREKLDESRSRFVNADPNATKQEKEGAIQKLELAKSKVAAATEGAAAGPTDTAASGEKAPFVSEAEKKLDALTTGSGDEASANFQAVKTAYRDAISDGKQELQSGPGGDVVEKTGRLAQMAGKDVLADHSAIFADPEKQKAYQAELQQFRDKQARPLLEKIYGAKAVYDSEQSGLFPKYKVTDPEALKAMEQYNAEFQKMSPEAQRYAQEVMQLPSSLDSSKLYYTKLASHTDSSEGTGLAYAWDATKGTVLSTGDVLHGWATGRTERTVQDPGWLKVANNTLPDDFGKFQDRFGDKLADNSQKTAMKTLGQTETAGWWRQAAGARSIDADLNAYADAKAAAAVASDIPTGPRQTVTAKTVAEQKVHDIGSKILQEHAPFAGAVVANSPELSGQMAGFVEDKSGGNTLARLGDIKDWQDDKPAVMNNQWRNNEREHFWKGTVASTIPGLGTAATVFDANHYANQSASTSIAADYFKTSQLRESAKLASDYESMSNYAVGMQAGMVAGGGTILSGAAYKVGIRAAQGARVTSVLDDAAKLSKPVISGERAASAIPTPTPAPAPVAQAVKAVGTEIRNVADDIPSAPIAAVVDNVGKGVEVVAEKAPAAPTAAVTTAREVASSSPGSAGGSGSGGYSNNSTYRGNAPYSAAYQQLARAPSVSAPVIAPRVQSSMVRAVPQAAAPPPSSISIANSAAAKAANLANDAPISSSGASVGRTVATARTVDGSRETYAPTARGIAAAARQVDRSELATFGARGVEPPPAPKPSVASMPSTTPSRSGTQQSWREAMRVSQRSYTPQRSPASFSPPPATPASLHAAAEIVEETASLADDAAEGTATVANASSASDTLRTLSDARSAEALSTTSASKGSYGAKIQAAKAAADEYMEKLARLNGLKTAADNPEQLAQVTKLGAAAYKKKVDKSIKFLEKELTRKHNISADAIKSARQIAESGTASSAEVAKATDLLAQDGFAKTAVARPKISRYTRNIDDALKTLAKSAGEEKDAAALTKALRKWDVPEDTAARIAASMSDAVKNGEKVDDVIPYMATKLAEASVMAKEAPVLGASLFEGLGNMVRHPIKFTKSAAKRVFVSPFASIRERILGGAKKSAPSLAARELAAIAGVKAPAQSKKGTRLSITTRVALRASLKPEAKLEKKIAALKRLDGVDTSGDAELALIERQLRTEVVKEMSATDHVNFLRKNNGDDIDAFDTLLAERNLGARFRALKQEDGSEFADMETLYARIQQETEADMIAKHGEERGRELSAARMQEYREKNRVIERDGKVLADIANIEYAHLPPTFKQRNIDMGVEYLETYKALKIAEKVRTGKITYAELNTVFPAYIHATWLKHNPQDIEKYHPNLSVMVDGVTYRGEEAYNHLYHQALNNGTDAVTDFVTDLYKQLDASTRVKNVEIASLHNELFRELPFFERLKDMQKGHGVLGMISPGFLDSSTHASSLSRIADEADAALKASEQEVARLSKAVSTSDRGQGTTVELARAQKILEESRTARQAIQDERSAEIAKRFAGDWFKIKIMGVNPARRRIYTAKSKQKVTLGEFTQRVQARSLKLGENSTRADDPVMAYMREYRSALEVLTEDGVKNADQIAHRYASTALSHGFVIAKDGESPLIVTKSKMSSIKKQVDDTLKNRDAPAAAPSTRSLASLPAKLETLPALLGSSRAVPADDMKSFIIAAQKFGFDSQAQMEKFAEQASKNIDNTDFREGLVMTLGRAAEVRAVKAIDRKQAIDAAIDDLLLELGRSGDEIKAFKSQPCFKVF